MIIFSPRLENYQFSQPRLIFLIYGNTMYVFSIYLSRKCSFVYLSMSILDTLWWTCKADPLTVIVPARTKYSYIMRTLLLMRAQPVCTMLSVDLHQILSYPLSLYVYICKSSVCKCSPIFCGICRRQCHYEFNTAFQKSCIVFCAKPKEEYPINPISL